MRVSQEQPMNEDKRAFRNAMSDVTPLTPQNRAETNRPAIPAVPVQTRKDERAVIDELDRPFDDADVLEHLETGEELLFSRSGLSNKVFRKLRRGHFSVTDTIDLHHMDVPTAKACLADFIEHSSEQGHGCVRVIHGKGLRSPGVAKLKLLTNHLLRRHKAVIAFASCRAVDGGTGAVNVLLSSKRLKSS
jgi:DNA-nicking Smr family endonuclease